MLSQLNVVHKIEENKHIVNTLKFYILLFRSKVMVSNITTCNLIYILIKGVKKVTEI